MSTASNLAVALAGCLENITIANGYATDLGAKVLRGRRRLTDADLPCVVIIEGDDRVMSESRSAQMPNARRKQVKLEQMYTLEGHLPCDPDHPNDAAHAAIADLKKAVFKDVTLGGLVRDIDYAGRTISAREDGIDVVSGAIIIKLDYTEDLANP